jgi:hypothetical protein
VKSTCVHLRGNTFRRRPVASDFPRTPAHTSQNIPGTGLWHIQVSSVLPPCTALADSAGRTPRRPAPWPLHPRAWPSPICGAATTRPLHDVQEGGTVGGRTRYGVNSRIPRDTPRPWRPGTGCSTRPANVAPDPSEPQPQPPPPLRQSQYRQRRSAYRPASTSGRTPHTSLVDRIRPRPRRHLRPPRRADESDSQGPAPYSLAFALLLPSWLRRTCFDGGLICCCPGLSSTTEQERDGEKRAPATARCTSARGDACASRGRAGISR